MANYKEIVTKAIIGKGKKVINNTYTMNTEETPNTILGCWVINHNFQGKSINNSIMVDGSFDVNVWYSYDNDTKTGVSKESFSYSDKMNLKLKNNNSYDSNNEIIVKCLNQPTVTNVNLENGKVKLNLSKEMGVEILGDTKVKIMVDEKEDDYEIIPDEADETKISKEIDESVDENYLK